jgi:hypothetical protein
LEDSVLGPLRFNRHGEAVPSRLAVVRVERWDRSRPYMFEDLAGG